MRAGYNEDDVRALFALALMASGAPLIYHGRLATDALVGEPDLLKRIDRPSRLGGYSYAPADIKLGAAFESGKPKPHYVAQLCAYAELLDFVQGLRPASGWIIDRDDQWVELNLAEQWSDYQIWRDQALSIDAGAMTTVAARKSNSCDDCVWIEHCERDLHDRDDVTLVQDVGESKREKLWMVGIRTVSQLAEADPALLVTVKGIGAKSAEKWVRSAATLKRGIPEIRAAWQPPDVDLEVSYDIEDFLFERSVYLHGLLARSRDGEAEPYEGICAVAGEAEKAVWRRFLDSIDRLHGRGEYCVYVYSSHESTHLDGLVERHGGSAALTRFRERFVDLAKVVRDCVVFPTESNSLKEIARFCGFSWRDDDPGGKQSIAWWAQYLDDPVSNAALRERVLRYNEDDVRASFVVRDWIARACRS